MTTRHRFLRQERPRRPARGAALLTAMLVVALVATLTSAMVWQQWRAVQVEAAERSRLQSAWLLTGALELTRMALGTDARTSDSEYEVWARPLKEVRLSSFLAADKSNIQDAPDAFLSGLITDAQSRFNLRNLLEGDTVNPAAVAVLTRLCEFAGVGGGTAERIAARLRDAALPPGPQQPADAPLMPQSVEQLVWLGIDADTLRRLAPLVVLLPLPTPVNANTAPREVLAAVIEGLGLGGADRLMRARPLTVDTLKVELGAARTLDPGQVSVATSYFEVVGRLRLGEHVLQERSLVHRGRRGVAVIWRERTSLREMSP